MKSCAFFGHRDYDYREQETFIRAVIVTLIEHYSVTQFYAGGRGKFDYTCAHIIHNLKSDYSNIKLTQVLSYMPKQGEKYSSEYYDDTIYVLERNVPKKYAIIETNKAIVDKVDFVISGVDHDWGGAAKAVEYAYKKGKAVIEIFAGTNKERRVLEFFNMESMPLSREAEERLSQRAENAICRIQEEKMQEERKKCKKNKFLQIFFKNPPSKA